MTVERDEKGNLLSDKERMTREDIYPFCIHR